MATHPSSSSSSAEISAKPHPYQTHDNDNDFFTGPKTPFEFRQLNNGLYIRVDMPGVPKDAVKVIKYNETRTVTFTGKAPPLWPGFDSSNPRVYAGYVVLDRDLSNVDFTSEVDDGVLRLFFPNCDGFLHSLGRHNEGSTSLGVQTEEDEEDDRKADPNITFILHSPLDQPSGIALSGGTSEHINPHLLSGLKGVYEHKIVTTNAGEHLIFIRLDVPGTCRKANIIMENSDRGIMFQAMGFEDEKRFGEGKREYVGILQPSCYCCRYRVVKYDTTDGVMRFLVRKSDNPDPTPLCHCTLPPARPGGDLQPTTLKLAGNMPPSLESRKFH